MKLYRKILALLTTQEKRRGALVLGMVIIMAVLETASIASVMPFLAVLGDPEMVQTIPILASIYNTLGFQSMDAFLFALGTVAFGVILFSALSRLRPWRHAGSMTSSRLRLGGSPEGQIIERLPISAISNDKAMLQSLTLSKACLSVCQV